MIQKQGNWMPYELKPRDIERRFFTCEQLIQRQQRKDFLHQIVTEMRSRYSTTTPRRKNIKYAKPGQSTIAIDLNINTAEDSWFEDHALYLVGPKGSCLL